MTCVCVCGRRVLGHRKRGVHVGGTNNVYIPQHSESDAAAVLAHACVFQLSADGDPYCSALLTPNLARLWKADADRVVRALARSLNWPRVRLLFIGQREGGDEGGEVLVPEGAGPVAAVLARGGCLLSTLGSELLTLVAEWLVVLEAEDDEPQPAEQVVEEVASVE